MYYILHTTTAVCTEGEKNVNELEIISKKKGFESHIICIHIKTIQFT